jgi:hypothetical protein
VGESIGSLETETQCGGAGLKGNADGDVAEGLDRNVTAAALYHIIVPRFLARGSEEALLADSMKDFLSMDGDIAGRIDAYAHLDAL